MSQHGTITIQEVGIMLQIISSAAERGGIFAPTDLEVVGALYNKLTHMFQAARTKVQHQQKQSEPTDKAALVEKQTPSAGD